MAFTEPWHNKTHNLRSAQIPEPDRCGCGCGRPQAKNREQSSKQLGAALKTVKLLKTRVASAGDDSDQAESLLWAWSRCEDGFHAYVHRTDWKAAETPMPPTAAWLDAWMRRAAQLGHRN